MGEFEVVRRTTINADAATIHALINDFHHWPTWSPWEELDPQMQRTFTGPESGVGAHYAWQGNRKAGKGSMEITSADPGLIKIELIFMLPWKATNQISFELTPTSGTDAAAGDGAGAGGADPGAAASGASSTEVSWWMRGQQRGLMAVVGKFMPMDKMVGKDFESGLAKLKKAAESGK